MQTRLICISTGRDVIVGRNDKKKVSYPRFSVAHELCILAQTAGSQLGNVW
jgi:hypothetical protein